MRARQIWKRNINPIKEKNKITSFLFWNKKFFLFYELETNSIGILFFPFWMIQSKMRTISIGRPRVLC